MNYVDFSTNKITVQTNDETNQWISELIGWPSKKPTYKEKFKNYIIKKVIVSGPATIVFFSDKTKIVVKCSEGETFDLEKALALAIARKALGNKGSYLNFIKDGMKKAEYTDTKED